MLLFIHSKSVYVIRAEKKVTLLPIIAPFPLEQVPEDIARLGCYSNRALVPLAWLVVVSCLHRGITLKIFYSKEEITKNQ